MIVSDTTPISNLLHLEKVSLLTELFGTVYIPVAVATELETAFSVSKIWRDCLARKQIAIESISNAILAKQLTPFLHQGEAEAICLALEKQAKLCLIDDKDGRTIARMNSVPIFGTVGLLLKAKNAGLITSVKHSMDKLRNEHHFWIKEDVYRKALSLAEEKA